jgi:hypothetical protein
LALLFLLGFPSPARAQAVDAATQAQRLFGQGEIAAERGDYAGAIVAFEASYDLFPRPHTLRNIALYQHEAGRFVDAARSWNLLLERYGPDISHETREVAEERLAQLELLVARVPLSVPLDGAVVLLDGREIGTGPFQQDVVVELGTHVFEARCDGYEAARSSALLRAGRNPPVSLVPQPLPETPSVLRIESETEGALVSIDDAPAVPIPVIRNVPPGEHRLRVEAPGHLAETRTVTVPRAGRVVASFNLAPLTPDPIGPPPPPPVEEAGFWDGPWPWVIGGILVLGAAGATAGVLLWPEDEPDSLFTLRVR